MSLKGKGLPVKTEHADDHQYHATPPVPKTTATLSRPTAPRTLAIKPETTTTTVTATTAPPTDRPTTAVLQIMANGAMRVVANTPGGRNSGLPTKDATKSGNSTAASQQAFFMRRGTDGQMQLLMASSQPGKYLLLQPAGGGVFQLLPTTASTVTTTVTTTATATSAQAVTPGSHTYTVTTSGLISSLPKLGSVPATLKKTSSQAVQQAGVHTVQQAVPQTPLQKVGHPHPSPSESFPETQAYTEEWDVDSALPVFFARSPRKKTNKREKKAPKAASLLAGAMKDNLNSAEKQTAQSDADTSEMADSEDGVFPFRIDSVFSLSSDDHPFDETADGEKPLSEIKAEAITVKDEEEVAQPWSQEEMLAMCGASFVVLERLAEADVDEKGPPHAHLQPRCSEYCRKRTLNYMCMLDLIRCPEKKRRVKIEDFSSKVKDEICERNVKQEKGKMDFSEGGVSEDVKPEKLTMVCSGREREIKKPKPKLKPKPAVSASSQRPDSLGSLPSIIPSNLPPSTAIDSRVSSHGHSAGSIVADDGVRTEGLPHVVGGFTIISPFCDVESGSHKPGRIITTAASDPPKSAASLQAIQDSSLVPASMSKSSNANPNPSATKPRPSDVKHQLLKVNPRPSDVKTPSGRSPQHEDTVADQSLSDPTTNLASRALRKMVKIVAGTKSFDFMVTKESVDNTPRTDIKKLLGALPFNITPKANSAGMMEMANKPPATENTVAKGDTVVSAATCRSNAPSIIVNCLDPKILTTTVESKKSALTAPLSVLSSQKVTSGTVPSNITPPVSISKRIPVAVSVKTPVGVKPAVSGARTGQPHVPTSMAQVKIVNAASVALTSNTTSLLKSTSVTSPSPSGSGPAVPGLIFVGKSDIVPGLQSQGPRLSFVVTSLPSTSAGSSAFGARQSLVALVANPTTSTSLTPGSAKTRLPLSTKALSQPVKTLTLIPSISHPSTSTVLSTPHTSSRTSLSTSQLSPVTTLSTSSLPKTWIVGAGRKPEFHVFPVSASDGQQNMGETPVSGTKSTTPTTTTTREPCLSQSMSKASVVVSNADSLIPSPKTLALPALRTTVSVTSIGNSAKTTQVTTSLPTLLDKQFSTVVKSPSETSIVHSKVVSLLGNERQRLPVTSSVTPSNRNASVPGLAGVTGAGVVVVKEKGRKRRQVQYILVPPAASTNPSTSNAHSVPNISSPESRLSAVSVSSGSFSSGSAIQTFAVTPSTTTVTSSVSSKTVPTTLAAPEANGAQPAKLSDSSEGTTKRKKRKIYAMPPGVVIKTEPVTHGYPSYHDVTSSLEGADCRESFSSGEPQTMTSATPSAANSLLSVTVPGNEGGGPDIDRSPELEPEPESHAETATDDVGGSGLYDEPPVLTPIYPLPQEEQRGPRAASPASRRSFAEEDEPERLPSPEAAPPRSSSSRPSASSGTSPATTSTAPSLPSASSSASRASAPAPASISSSERIRRLKAMLQQQNEQLEEIRRQRAQQPPLVLEAD